MFHKYKKGSNDMWTLSWWLSPMPWSVPLSLLVTIHKTEKAPLTLVKITLSLFHSPSLWTGFVEYIQEWRSQKPSGPCHTSKNQPEIYHGDDDEVEDNHDKSGDDDHQWWWWPTWNLQVCVSRGKESKSIGQMKVMWVAWLQNNFCKLEVVGPMCSNFFQNSKVRKSYC